MGNEAEVNIRLTMDVDDLEKNYLKIKNQSKKVTDEVGHDWEALGSRSIRAIEDERRRVVLAFQRIKQSGVSSQEDVARASRAAKARLRELNAEAGRTEVNFRKVALAVGAPLTLAAALGGRQLIAYTREFEKLEAAMVTATGSEIAAAAALDEIRSIAKDTPFTLQEVTGSFIKLKNLGLEPSRASIMSYGNTAAAMGKNLDQMVEAVADATTGEFERLKEFGIKSRSEGDNVSFTFRGVTTTVRKEAAAIQDYLLGLGNTQFAGGLERQMDTLNGAVSNMQDGWAGMLAAIGGKGSSQAIGVLREMADLFDRIRRGIDPTVPEQIEEITAQISDLEGQIEAAEKLSNGNFFQRMAAEGYGNVDGMRSRVSALRAELEELQQTQAAGAAALAAGSSGGVVGEAGSSGVVPDEGDAVDAAAFARKQQMFADLEHTRRWGDERAQTERLEWLQKEQEDLQAAFEYKLALYQAEEDTRREIEEGKESARIRELRAEKAKEDRLLQGYRQFVNSMSALQNALAANGINSGNALFEAVKVTQAGIAFTSAYSAATQAMADPSSFTFSERLAKYTAVLATGLGAVASIKGAVRGGSGGGGGTSGGSPPSGTPFIPEAPQQQPAQQLGNLAGATIIVNTPVGATARDMAKVIKDEIKILEEDGQ